MDYKEVHIEVKPKNPFVDLLMDALEDVGFESFVETEDGFNAYILKKQYTPKLEETCWAWQLDGFEAKATVSDVPRQNWNAYWEANFDPILVNDEVYIFAPFHPAKPEIKHQIEIEPKMSFGTGHHQTTQLVVQHILAMNLENKKVLDMGCGTGVLGILAAQKGAASVMGIDIDDWSVENTRENAARNSVEMPVLLGGAEKLGPHVFDVIFANINLNILLADMAAYVAALAPGGTIVFSGFYNSDLPQLQAKAESLGLVYDYAKQLENWSAVSFTFPKK